MRPTLPPSATARFPAFLAGAAMVALLVSGVAGGWLLGRRIPAGDARPRLADTPALIRQVQGLNQVVTVKYVVEKVVLLEDVKWYGGNRLLMVAHGVVKAGIDLGRLGPGDLDVRGRRLVLALPRAQLTDVYLDDRRTQVVERSTGLLRTFDKDLEQDARKQAVEALKLGARDSGILKDAEDRARLQLTALFQAAGFGAVEFRNR
ncbi:MAG: DUF4230 domain-containing protein [Verrucomicrobiota bacterium]